MNRTHTTARIARIAAAIVLTTAAAAYAQENVFDASHNTEDALISALGLKTRSIRVGPAPKPFSGQAHLLITFDTDSAELSAQTRSMLDVLAHALQSDQLKRLNFRIEGHADARGDSGHNQKLSQERADSVTAYLVGRYGIDAARLTPEGKGSSEPLNLERIDAPENRRVSVVRIDATAN
ncbi:MAG: OmpA family protein [Proteobacteria bacterium]|nr:OmpA family protein [Pseudomonadota bacterium]